MQKKSKKSSSFKVQSSVEEYTLYVLEGLIGIQGTNTSDVISSILRSWMRDNSDKLDSWGLGIKEWKERKRGNNNSNI